VRRLPKNDVRVSLTGRSLSAPGPFTVSGFDIGADYMARQRAWPFFDSLRYVKLPGRAGGAAVLGTAAAAGDGMMARSSPPARAAASNAPIG
jgi:hypothetical protein